MGDKIMENTAEESLVYFILKEEHQSIDKIVDKITEVVNGLTVESFEQPRRKDIKILMDFFHNRLLFHIGVEKNMGILQDIVDERPRLRNQVEEITHARFGIQHPLVHVDVNELSPTLHLPSRNDQSVVQASFFH